MGGALFSDDYFSMKKGVLSSDFTIRGTVVTKAPLRVQFLPALGGEGVGKG